MSFCRRWRFHCRHRRCVLQVFEIINCNGCHHWQIWRFRLYCSRRCHCRHCRCCRCIGCCSTWRRCDVMQVVIDDINNCRYSRCKVILVTVVTVVGMLVSISVVVIVDFVESCNFLPPANFVFCQCDWLSLLTMPGLVNSVYGHCACLFVWDYRLAAGLFNSV